MSKPADPLELPFDQYQRYRLVADLLGELRGKRKRLKILDVGGRTALLRRFLTDDVTLVDVEASNEEGLVLGDGGGLPFKDGAFDAVTAFDTLEHVPPRARKRFVEECSRVAKKWVILAGPYDAPRVAEAEELLKRFLKEKLGIEHRYLNEHRQHGLPKRKTVENNLKKCGAEVASFGHANLDRWLVLMCLSMYMDDDPSLRGLAQSFHRFYNCSLYDSDHAEPVYRHLVVAAFDGAKLPDASKFLAPPVAPDEALPPFIELEVELLAFDKERQEWREEREKLKRVSQDLEKDLAGHKVSLGTAQADTHAATEVARTLSDDLEGHRLSLAKAEEDHERLQKVAQDLEEDLIGHRASLSEARAELKSRADVIHELTSELETERRVGEEARGAMARDLAEHRKTIETLRAELATARTACDQLEAELKSNREAEEEVRKTLERDLSEHKKVLAVRERELREHRETTEALRAEVEAHRASAAALAADLDGHREVHSEHGRELQARRAQAAALERELEGHRATATALEADLALHRKTLAETQAIVDEKAAGIETLEFEVRRLDGVAKKIQGELVSANANATKLGEDLAQRTHELQVREAELEAKDAELQRRASRITAQETEIERLRGELRDRWRSLKRAVSFKKPNG